MEESKRQHVLKVILALFLLSAPGTVAAQNAGVFRLAGVTVVGSKRYDGPAIAHATGLKVGDNLTIDSLNEAARKLGTLGVFSQVTFRYTTRGNAMNVVFTVEDAGQLLPCTFGNFLWFSPQELREGLRSRVPLFDGNAPPGGAMLDLISAALVAMLETRGIHAQVQFLPQGQAGGPIQSMQFRAVGVPIPVRKIDFTGVQKVDATIVQQAAKPLLDKDYDMSTIRDFARGTVVNVYRERGYLRADFGDPVPQFLSGDPTPNAVAVTIPVTEGEQYHLKEIAWSGDSVIPYTELAKSLHGAVGAPLNAVQLEQDALSLLLLFHPQGYLTADVRANAVLDDASHSAVYQIQIRQGNLYRLGKLEIVGLDDAHARSLAQLSKIHTGDPYEATYWSKFLPEAARHLPPPASDWRFNFEQTIHADTQTVDVRLTFTPAPTK
jgi:outer membrane protein assembly factor BamA